MAKESRKLIANNKKAFHDYFIEDTWEAGIALVGTEVKSLRMGKCSLKESFIQIHKGEVIKIRFVQESFLFIDMRLTRLLEKSTRRAIH